MALADLTRMFPGATAASHGGPQTARVLQVIDDGRLLLEQGGTARRAAGCLLTPAAGDRVLVWSDEGGTAWALTVLERGGNGIAELSVDGAEGIALRADTVDVLARRRLSLSSLADVEINSVTGSLALRARHLLTSVQQSMVENIGERISRMGQWLVDAGSHLRLHARDASLTADKDIRLDADRINMG